jgi:sugar phosphate isomerase/epimerase
MTDASRRRFLQWGAVAAPLVIAPGLAGAADKAASSKVGGVQIGVQTYSFHDIVNDGRDHSREIIADMKACGLNMCELFSHQIMPAMYYAVAPKTCREPARGCAANEGGDERNPYAYAFQPWPQADRARRRAEVKQWIVEPPKGYFETLRRRFDDAGVRVYTFNPSMFYADSSDAEIDGLFRIAMTLGAKAINASIHWPQLQRVLPFAERHKMVIAVHGHGAVWDKEAFSTRETFVRAMNLSPWVGVNLDIGHYSAAGQDSVEFINAFHERITNLHLKDRKRNHATDHEDGATVPWGQGITPIREVLLLLKRKQYPIPAFIEHEHMGGPSVQEVSKAYAYCRQILARA